MREQLSEVIIEPRVQPAGTTVAHGHRPMHNGTSLIFRFVESAKVVTSCHKHHHRSHVGRSAVGRGILANPTTS